MRLQTSRDIVAHAISQPGLCCALLTSILLFSMMTSALAASPIVRESTQTSAHPPADHFSRNSPLDPGSSSDPTLRPVRVLDGEYQHSRRPQLGPALIPGDEHWQPFTLNGIGDGWVLSLATDGSNIFAGGRFSTAGGSFANNVAEWNASSGFWEPLGTGMNGSVDALAADRNGNLYAGGEFTEAGGVAVKYIARWDGHTWSALGSGSSYFVSALVTDSGGNLYAGGGFSGSGIAKWSASTQSWSIPGGGIVGGVKALAVDKNNNIYAGGIISTAGGVNVNNIAKWNGTTWSALGSGVNGEVVALATDDDENLYATGLFTSAGGVSAENIAMWNGTHWSSLGSGVSAFAYETMPRALAVSDGDVYVAGGFTAAGGISANRIAKWDGTNWSALDGGAQDRVCALTVDDLGNIYAGGSFSAAGDVAANHVAKWNGTSWSVLGIDNSVSGEVSAVVVGRANQVYVAGDFTFAGGQPANGIAMWSGAKWMPLGSGIPTFADPYAGVEALAVGVSDHLYAGGGFTMTGGINTNHIAKWNDSGWSALDTGTNGPVDAVVTDNQGNLYAGGRFTTAGATNAKNVAMWNISTTRWQALALGLEGGVSALAIDGDGNLYAGGTFTRTGELVVNHVAKWNGGNWSALGSGVCCGGTNKGGMDMTRVSAMGVDESGNVYVAGNFSQAGGVSAFNIAMWNGDGWEALGSGVGADPEDTYPSFPSMTLQASGGLVVGGNIDWAGNETVQGIARWDGQKWSPMGSGLACTYTICVHALAADGDGNIYAGGLFTVAGGRPTANFAKWWRQIYSLYFPLVARHGVGQSH